MNVLFPLVLIGVVVSKGNCILKLSVVGKSICVRLNRFKGEFRSNTVVAERFCGVVSICVRFNRFNGELSSRTVGAERFCGVVGLSTTTLFDIL